MKSEKSMKLMETSSVVSEVSMHVNHPLKFSIITICLIHVLQRWSNLEKLIEKKALLKFAPLR